MPQIEQIQPVYWGALRPDPIDLAADGINVATGPNGCGKTTLLDAIKLIYGVAPDGLSRRPADYIFDGGGDATLRADRALVKAVFANPERPNRRGRVFADAGRGCEAAPYVTAICEVTRDGRRRFGIYAGYLDWGGNGDTVDADIQRLRELIPAKQWMSAQKWSELLARAGVSRELLGVLAVRQGETDKTIEGRPEDLLRRVLELTGRQETLDNFRAAKQRLLEARTDYDQTMQKLLAERRHLETLGLQAREHEQFVRASERRRRIAEVELPAAKRTELVARRERLESEQAGMAERLESERTALEENERDIAAFEDQSERVGGRVRELKEARRKAVAKLEAAAGEVGAARTRLEQARQAVGAAGEPLDTDHVCWAEQDAVVAEARLADTEAERARLEQEISDLAAGLPVRPSDVDEFRATLDAAGIASELVAERLEAPTGIAAEAALAEKVWTLVVVEADFESAVALAVEHGYRRPLAISHEGAPSGALAGAAGLPEAGAFLAEVTLPLDRAPGVSRDGLVRGETWAAFRAPEQPVLGTAAREAALRTRRERHAAIETALPDERRAAADARDRATALRLGLEAKAKLDALAQQLRAAEERQRKTSERESEVGDQLAVAVAEASRVTTELDGRRRRRQELTKLTSELTPRVARYDTQFAEIDHALASLPAPTDEPDEELLPVAVLEHDLARLDGELADESRFPPEVRTELVLAHRENQARTVEGVEQLVRGRREALEAVEAEVERAKLRYDQHIRQVVGLLGRRFRDVCEQARMVGEIEIVPAEVEGEFGIDVKVAHAPGEPVRSYRSRAHSTGQKAKISILLLLAAMSLEGSADLLIMDEHSAHLDSRNIDDVAEAMNALKDKVQFILATPTNAEAGRLEWCDHQLAFYPRAAGEPFAPSVVLMTHRPEGERRYLTMGQLSLAD